MEGDNSDHWNTNHSWSSTAREAGIFSIPAGVDITLDNISA